MRTKNKAITIYVTEADYASIHTKAERCGKSLTAYLTTCGLGKQIIVVDGIEKLIGQTKRVGQHLNQISALANSGKIQVAYLDKATEQFAEINQGINNILERRRWSNGDNSLHQSPEIPDESRDAVRAEIHDVG
jgi:hypothetical protein